METPISANSLFHFTSDQKVLLNILKEGFYVRYSLEDYSKLLKDHSQIVFPMTSFCDIPLSLVKRHTLTYGSYAIGLSKDWGIKKKVSPVIYAYPNSKTSEILEKIYSNIERFFDVRDDEKTKKKETEKETLSDFFKNFHTPIKMDFIRNLAEIENELSDFIRYIKPYEGKIFRNNQYIEDPVCFYNEREWRFTPEKSFFKGKKDIKDSYVESFYTDSVKRRRVNINLCKYIRLKFQPQDIKFIIVKSDSEIPGMIDKMARIEWQNASDYDLKILSTRLISLEQILENV